MSAKGVVSALPVVSAISTENENSNEFKTPLHFARSSPRLGTPVNTLLGKTSDSLQNAETPVQTPEAHRNNPANSTPVRENDGTFTPTIKDRSESEEKNVEPVPAFVLCDLANKVLDIANRRGWLPAVSSTDSPRKVVVG